MRAKLSRFFTIAALTTLTCVIVTPSNAHHPSDSKSMDNKSVVNTIEETTPLSINRLLNEAYHQNGGDFFQQTSLMGTLNTIFGWESVPKGSFPENNVSQTGLLLYAIVDDYFRQVQLNNPTMRTRDLPNPFDTSIYDNKDNPDYLID